MKCHYGDDGFLVWSLRRVPVAEIKEILRPAEDQRYRAVAAWRAIYCLLYGLESADRVNPYECSIQMQATNDAIQVGSQRAALLTDRFDLNDASAHQNCQNSIALLSAQVASQERQIEVLTAEIASLREQMRRAEGPLPDGTAPTHTLLDEVPSTPGQIFDLDGQAYMESEPDDMNTGTDHTGTQDFRFNLDFDIDLDAEWDQFEHTQESDVLHGMEPANHAPDDD